MPEDEISFDLTKLGVSKDKVMTFFKKYGIVFLILIPLLLAVSIRLTSESLPMTDNWAKSSVENYYKNAIKTQVTQQYPNLPAENIQTLADQQYSTYYNQNKATIEEQIKQTSLQLKSYFQDEKGYTYMPDIDPYVFLQYARSYLDHGYTADKIINGTYWNTHVLAPNGGPGEKYNSQGMALAYLYKIMSIFNSKITLMQSSTYFPIIIVALCIIPIFFIGRKFAGNIGGFFAALLFAVNGAFLGRTGWGHADTDAWNIFFPVYAIWFFFMSMHAKDTKKKIIHASLSGLSLGLFSLFWSGWWYVFDFMLGAIGIYILYLIFIEHKFSLQNIKENKELKHFIITALLFFITSGIFVSLFSSPTSFATSVMQPVVFSSIKQASHENLWPNVYTTVAELNSASYSSIISSIGGNIFVISSLLGLFLLFLIKTDGKREYLLHAILFTLWFVGIFYASTKGIRFTMMLAPPIALATGAAIGILYGKITSYCEKIGMSKKIAGITLIILLLVMIFPQISGGYAAIKNDIPMINDAWYNSLTKIKNESQPNAIVNSWWDFGHHFKYFTDRGVTFDGGTQNSPMAHWIGKVLLTNNEKEAIGILRMLDCGSNGAFDILNEKINDTSVSVNILNSIIVMDKSSAQTYLLNKKIDKNVVDSILQKTHCSPPEDYFITSEDMVSKAGVWAHFGSWNFDKADIWLYTKNLPKDEAIKSIQSQMSISEEDAKKIYYEVKSITNENDANTWIATWPGYSQSAGCTKQDNSSLICGGINIDLTTMDVKINTDEGLQKPYSISYVENGNFVEKKFDNGLSQSILLIKKEGSYGVIISSPELASSTFTKLFFYDGIGLKQFSKFDEESQPIGGKISVWKIVW